MQRVVAYCRVSTKEELQLHSLKAQQEYYEKWIKERIIKRFLYIDGRDMYQ